MDLDTLLGVLLPKKTNDESTIYTLLKQYAVLLVRQQVASKYEEIINELQGLISNTSKNESPEVYRKLLFCTLFVYQTIKSKIADNERAPFSLLKPLFQSCLKLASEWKHTNCYFRKNKPIVCQFKLDEDNIYLFAFLFHQVLKTVTKILAIEKDACQIVAESISSRRILQDIVLKFYSILKEKVENAEIEQEHEVLLLDLKVSYEMAADFALNLVKKGNFKQIQDSLESQLQSALELYVWNPSSMSEQLREIANDLSIHAVQDKYSARFFSKMHDIVFTFIRKLFQADSSLSSFITNEFNVRYLSLPCQPISAQSLLSHEAIKFVELLFQGKKYDINDVVIKSEKYWRDLRQTLELYDNIEASKQGVNAMKGILEAISLKLSDKQIKNDKVLSDFGGIYIRKFKAFLDIYQTLDSYAVHLIKSMWPQLTKFFEKDPPNISTIVEKLPILSQLDSKWPVFILFKKAIFHNNHNIVKTCVKYFLKMDSVDIDYLQDLVYDQTIPILNNSLFYNDVPLDADSKFYPVVRTFFLTAYTKAIDSLKSECQDDKEFEVKKTTFLNYHLKRFLSSICKHIAYPQAICALLSVFYSLPYSSTFVGSEEIKLILDFTSRIFSRSNLRKRTIFAKALSIMLIRHFDIANVQSDEAIELVLSFPRECFEWKSVHELKPEQFLSFLVKQNSENKESAVQDGDENDYWKLWNDSFFYQQKLLIFLIRFADQLKISEYFDKLIISVQSNSSIDTPNIRVQSFNQLLKLANILLEVPSLSQSLTEIVSKNDQNLNLKEISFFASFTKHGELQKRVSSWLFQNKLSDIYTNSYRPADENTQTLIQLRDILKLFKNTLEISALCRSLETVSSDLLSYLKLQILQSCEEKSLAQQHQQAQQKQDGSQFEGIVCEVIKEIAYISVLPRCIDPSSSKLSQSLSKFINGLFQDLIKYLSSSTLTSTEEEHACIITQLLSRVCLSQLLVIDESAKEGTTQEVFIDEVLFKEGMDLAGRLTIQQSKQPGFKQLSLKRGFLAKSNSLLCGILSVLSLSSEIQQSDQFKSIIDSVIEDSFSLTDVFDAQRLDELFQMMKRVYNPWLVSHLSEHNASQLIGQFKSLFEMNLQNLLASRISTLNFKEVNSFYDWVLDSILLSNKYIQESNVIQEIVNKSFKSGQNYWLIQRKVVDSLFTVFFANPSLLRYFQTTVYRILKISEYRGFDNGIEFYSEELEVPFANELKKKSKNNMEYFGAYPRFMMLKLLENVVQWVKKCVEDRTELETQKENFVNVARFLIEFTFDILERNYANKYLKSRNSLLPSTKHYNRKIRTWQGLCVLKDFFTPDVLSLAQELSQADSKPNDEIIDSSKIVEKLQNKVWGIMQHNNQINIRQYIEIFTLHLYDKFPQNFEQLLIEGIHEKNNRSQLAIPLIFMAGYQVCRKPQNPRVREIMANIIPYTCSHVAYLRSIAQYFVSKFTEENPKFAEGDALIENLRSYYAENKESVKMKKNFDKIICKFEAVIEDFSTEKLLNIDMDGNGDIVHENVIEQIKAECMALIYNFKEIEDAPHRKGIMWKLRAEEVVKDIVLPEISEATNFQRKIDVVENELDQIEIEKKKRRKEKDLIVVASLLEKTPNFGHLTRTSEIFGVSALTVPNRAVLEEEGFKAISVTAEKWLPILEVTENNLMTFLLLKKKLGYKIVGLEQTSKSKMIQDTEFPDRCVLLLGKEKTGIPLEYIEILDECVEIPQYGQVRSLNVHVSASICIWEFVKQKFITE